MSNMDMILLVSGASLEIITDKTAEGNQFVQGFGGIGGKSFTHMKWKNAKVILMSITVIHVISKIYFGKKINGERTASKPSPWSLF